MVMQEGQQELNTFSQIVYCMIFDYRRLVLNSFLTSHFSYCPTVRIFHRRKLNERIINTHFRALRIVYKDFKSSFQVLLAKDSIYHRNLQKIFKSKNDLPPELINDIFEFIGKPYSYEQIFNSGHRGSIKQKIA